MSTPVIYGKDGIYRSPRPPISLPKDPRMSMIPFLFRDITAISKIPALVDAETGHALTFSDLRTQVFKLSQALLSLNISKNDVVLILSPNSILFPLCFFAIVSIGAIAATANPQYTINELTKQVLDSNPKLIITIHELYDKIKNFGLPCVMISPKTSSFVDRTTNDPIWYYQEMMKSDDTSKVRTRPSVLQTDAAAILYSSGTTGTSKGVVLTHRNFIASALMTTSDQETSNDPKNVVLCFLPMFHVFGLSTILYAQLQRGNTVVIMAHYEIGKVLMAIERYKVTLLYVVPPVIVTFVKQNEIVKLYDISCLREIATGAAPLGKDVMEECGKVFPQAALYQGYGMTETCGVISVERQKATTSRHSGSTGVLNPGVEAQIIDIQTMKPLPPFKTGEIRIRGLNVMQGYFKKEKATIETIDDHGWLHTGDLGYFDEEGQLFVVDRIKELIKCKGFQVAPAELEELLLSHPKIKDAAVIGLPDAEAGEVPIAYIVPLFINSLAEEDVKKLIAQQAVLSWSENAKRLN
ncbi:4-coumarate--CoA ligase-like 7 [Dorcoceras hygrometricum]|uniref:4-coumarate--CoA ligase-like 7 n=1 Tax=Dorcoceras hygrometricum TaxID=472368 RepID=A0A2Z7DG70_9LAMI|nr:4-coumarate--CoA ligase-like 7 [Dorcoceras hygrometricum]